MARAVSVRLSPFSVLEVEPVRLTVSADSRLAASSKLERVRVDASKNRLAMVLPCRAGTFLTSREETSLKESVESRRSSISSRDRSCSASRSLRDQRTFSVAGSGGQGGGGSRAVPGHAESSLRSISTSSTPSVSVKRTRIFSSPAVGMFRPT